MIPTEAERRGAASRDTLVIIASLLVIGTCALWLSRGRGSDPSPQTAAERSLDERKETAKAWRVTLAFHPLTPSGRGALADALADQMRNARGYELVTEGQSAALADRIGEDLIARAGGPEAYLTHVDDSPSRWITPADTREWYIVETFLQGTTKPEPSDRSDPRTTLAEVLERAYRRSSPVGWAASEGAGMVAFYRAASEEQLWAEGYERLPEQFKDLTLVGGGHNAIRLRWPEITGVDLLRRDRSVLAALSILMVEADKGEPFAWITRWVWDPERRQWHCDAASRFGEKLHVAFY